MSAADEYEPSLRLCLVSRPTRGSCGFHLSRTQWDPYPWVSEVETGSAADRAGLVVGDCVLEVNGEDVLGLRIGAVALRVYEKTDQVRLLVWNSGIEYSGAIWCSGSGPTPLSLQRLASCLQSVVSLLECPVCLEVIGPPAAQCCNGHALCAGCRALTDRCPVCRVALGPRGRCLLADKLHTLLSATFLQPAAPKQKRSKAKSRQQAECVQLASRAPPAGSSPLFHCPLTLTEPCEALLKPTELLPHLRQHDGPLVQYLCRDGAVYLRLPLSRLTTVALPQGPTFVVAAAAHPSAPCLLVWLWLAAADATAYRLQLELPGRPPVSGAAFPLTASADSVLAQAHRCIALNDDDFDPATSKVKLTVLADCDLDGDRDRHSPKALPLTPTMLEGSV